MEERIPISQEEAAECRDSIRVGQMVPLRLKVEKNGHIYKIVQNCKVLGKYEHVFMVQVTKHKRECFRYIDLIIERRGRA